MKYLLLGIAFLAAIEAGARLALGDPPFGILFLVVAVATGIQATRER